MVMETKYIHDLPSLQEASYSKNTRKQINYFGMFSYYKMPFECFLCFSLKNNYFEIIYK